MFSKPCLPTFVARRCRNTFSAHSMQRTISGSHSAAPRFEPPLDLFAETPRRGEQKKCPPLATDFSRPRALYFSDVVSFNFLPKAASEWLGLLTSILLIVCPFDTRSMFLQFLASRLMGGASIHKLFRNVRYCISGVSISPEFSFRTLLIFSPSIIPCRD